MITLTLPSGSTLNAAVVDDPFSTTAGCVTVSRGRMSAGSAPRACDPHESVMVTVCSLIASNTMRPQRSAAVAVVSWAWATEGYARRISRSWARWSTRSTSSSSSM